MPPKEHSTRYMRQQIDIIKNRWLKNRFYPRKEIFDLYEGYLILQDLNINLEDGIQKSEKFCKEVEDFMVNNLQKTYESFIRYKHMTVQEVDDRIHQQRIPNVRYRLWSLVDIWMITYETPVPKLADIANSDQSVHSIVVLKKTNDGIGLLSNYEVPEGQKTLREIEIAWRKIYPEFSVKKTLSDMKEWGKREHVMHKTENQYKKVLRGLWAKLKTYQGETYDELIKRLFEECSEAVGLCADGHVGRLINVLAGFDDDFKSSMSPMEYFQHNIGLIAANESPVSFKIEQATRLMDEIQMPVEQRAAWLEAF